MSQREALERVTAELRSLFAKVVVAPQAAEPVAWRWHWNAGDEPDVWAYSETETVSDAHRTSQPLYTSPPAVPAGAVTDEQRLQLARAVYFAMGGQADDERRAQKVSRIQVAVQDGRDGVLSRAPSDGARRAPDVCPNCFDESDCASIDVCRAVHGGPSDTNPPSDDGWRAVPAEADQSMIDAARKAIAGDATALYRGEPDSIAIFYRAMLAAAPTPPTKGGA